MKVEGTITTGQRIRVILIITTAVLFSNGNAQDDPFAELEASTAPSISASTANERVQDAFDTLDQETRYGTNSQSDEELEREFQAWKKVYLDEFNNYKKDILKHWDTPETTDKTLWVKYSKDYQTKQVIDFENNEVRLEVLAAPDLDVDSFVSKQLAEIARLTPNQARREDRVLAAIDANQDINDEVNNAPMLANVSEQTSGSISGLSVKELAANARVVKMSPQAQPALKPVTTVVIPLPADSDIKRAKKYAKYVNQFADINDLSPSLIFAIMHTESAFNPVAQSHIPAFGLMQIVPESAGIDVSQKLYGEKRVFSAQYLFDPQNNVEAGASYLNILYYRYLKGIKNPLSRLYCTIAAYNTGAGNVAKAFSGERRLAKALPIINAKSAEEVYDTLIEKLPYDETKTYLKRVSDRNNRYQQIALK